MPGRLAREAAFPHGLIRQSDDLKTELYLSGRTFTGSQDDIAGRIQGKAFARP